MERTTRTSGEAAGAGQQHADAGVSNTQRLSGDDRRPYQPALDLPHPRSITPINLGFSMPNTPVETRKQSEPQFRAVETHQTQAVPSARPDPRRPVQRQARETNENAHPSRDPSQSSTGSSISKLDKVDKTSSEWEVLSDAGSRMNEGEVADVEELQKKVDKRRSNFQYLADELAALDAQIKAAEEKLKRAHEQGGATSGGNETRQ